MSLRSSRPRHSGFTLIEMIIVIIIITILGLFGVPALMRAYKSSQEFTIQSRLSQMETAIESFKTKHGFYPPDFTRIQNVNQFMNFLNRLAPNHSENTQAAGFAAGVRRVDVWWEQVGRHLGPESALTFWLSGIAKDKQFPLTFISSVGNCTALPPYNIQVDGQVNERDVIFDFGDNYLIAQKGLGPPTRNDPIWHGFAGYVCASSQLPDGREEPIVYFELASFRPTVDAFPQRVFQGGDTVYTIYPYSNPTTPGTEAATLFNKESFQLVTKGMDGFFGPVVPNPGSPAFPNPPVVFYSENVSDVKLQNRVAFDNICNFSKGRLEALLK